MAHDEVNNQNPLHVANARGTTDLAREQADDGNIRTPAQPRSSVISYLDEVIVRLAKCQESITPSLFIDESELDYRTGVQVRIATAESQLGMLKAIAFPDLPRDDEQDWLDEIEELASDDDLFR